jgi:hypothetical protein
MMLPEYRMGLLDHWIQRESGVLEAKGGVEAQLTMLHSGDEKNAGCA